MRKFHRFLGSRRSQTTSATPVHRLLLLDSSFQPIVLDYRLGRGVVKAALLGSLIIVSRAHRPDFKALGLDQVEEDQALADGGHHVFVALPARRKCAC